MALMNMDTFARNSLFWAITGVVSLSLSIYMYGKRGDRPVKRAFALLALYTGIWSFGHTFLAMAGNVEQYLSALRIMRMGAILIPAGLYSFVLSFLGKENKRQAGIAYGIAAFLIILSFTDLYAIKASPEAYSSYQAGTGLLFFLFPAMFMLYTGMSVYLLGVAFARTGGKRRRTEILCVLAGVFTGIAGGGLLHLPLEGMPVFPYTGLFPGTGIILAACAVTLRGRLDSRIMIKETTVLLGLVTAAYVALAGISHLGGILPGDVIRDKRISVFLPALMIVLILRPVESFARAVVDKYFPSAEYTHKKLLRIFSEEVLSILDLQKLMRVAVKELVEIMRLKNAVIFICSDEQHPEAMVHAGDLGPGYRPGGSDGIIHCMGEKGGYALMSCPSVDPRLKECAGNIGAELVFPLKYHNDMAGVLALGGKRSGNGFSRDDIETLLSAGRALTMAIMNARLFGKLSEAQAQAAQREKMAVIGTLSAAINHEICNPLGIARGQCEMFLLNIEEGIYSDKSCEELLEKAKDVMKKVIKETDRAAAITKKLSSFAKPSGGCVEKDVKITDELDEVISLLQHDLMLDNIELVREFPSEIPFIEADRKQVQEIFFNVLRNASQSIVSNGIIKIKVFDANCRVYVIVEDTGKGMDKDVLKRVFDPFFSTKSSGEGSGLGLFIVKQVVERNGGRISVSSVPGEGAAVTVEFPAALAVGAPGDRPAR